MVQNISVKELHDEINSNEDFILLDVRTHEEFNEAHIKGATLIPLQELPQRHNELDKDKEIIIYCRTGNRSLMAVRFLEQVGFTNIKNVEGGIMDWIRNGFEINN